MTSSPSAPKPTIKIENIVATVSIDQKIDLEEVERKLTNVEYEPEQFPGLIFRLEKPRVTALIFKSGKMVITGAKSTEELIRAVKTIFAILKKHGIVGKVRPRIQIQNIVASANLNVDVNLEKAAFLLENSMYEPEQFPGLIYRLEEPRVVLLLFSSGKMVVTGAKKEDEVKRAVEKVYKKLEELECIRKPDEDLTEEELLDLE
ncbi:TATA-box-binding protein [Ignicoccus pacificus DSM 13166]|uniref:TATA-box-binding protein n=1 Tax=Ignicoccus pacificus DSM 13166 TaxID=940294 RepID=A0A977PJA6_9CREN|nr:TATA-box-binding protein [Ignicoccus pacificus DSM 13166]